MIFSATREHYATWIGGLGIVFLFGAGWAAFEAEYTDALISGGIGGVLVFIAVLLLRSGRE